MPEWFPPHGYPSDYLAFWATFAGLSGGAWAFVRAARRSPGSRSRLLTGNLLVLLALGSLTALVGETYFRFAYDESCTEGDTLTNRAWMARHWVPHLNSMGFRDVEWRPERRPGVRRVVLLGDSITAGHGVPDPADRFGNRVRAALEQQEPGRNEVWVTGFTGWSTRHERDWLHETLPRAPIDHVVLCYCMNDIEDLLPDEEFVQRLHALDIPRAEWVNPTFSFLESTLRYRFERRRRADALASFVAWQAAAYDDPEIWRRQSARLTEIASLCRESGVRLDVVIFPFMALWGETYPLDHVHRRLLETFEGLGVQAIDLREVYRGHTVEELAAGPYDPHPGAATHALVAEVLLDRLFARDRR